MSREKRIETMIRAARLIKEERVKFLVVGSGPALRHYKAMVRKLGLGHRFTFTGFIANKELPMYYAAADAFCIPSKFETQGIAPIEAMACGKPVIGADFLALKELIVSGQERREVQAERLLRLCTQNKEGYK